MIIITLSLILFLCLVGYAILELLLVEEQVLLKLAYSFGLGVGVITMQMYLMSRFHLGWTVSTLVMPWLFFCFIVFISRIKKLQFSLPRVKVTRLQWLVVSGIIIAVAYTTFEALLRPVVTWDGWAIWLLRSKIFFIDNTVNPQVLKELLSDYPLVVSLLGTFVYLALGRVNDSVVLLTSVAFYASTALLIFAEIKKRFGLGYGLFFTFLFATTQSFVRQGGRLEAGQADLPFAYFALICTVLLLTYLKNSSGRYIFVLCLFLGLTSLIKHEGLPFVICMNIIVCYHIYKNRLYTHLFALLLWIVPLVDWQLYVSTHALKNSYITLDGAGLQESIATLGFVFKELFNIKSWGFLWIVYFYALFIFRWKSNKELYLLNYIILSQLLIYVSLYIISPTVYTPESSWQRLLVHVAPIVLLYLAIITRKLKITIPLVNKYM